MQGGDQQCNHPGVCSTSPCKHSKAFLPLLSILVICKNTLLLMDKKGRTWGQLLLRIQQARLKVGPGGVSRCTGMSWLCGVKPTQTQDYKTLLSLPVSVIYIVLEGDSLEHTSRNCWTWWVSPHYLSHWTYYQVTQHLKVCCYEDTQICWKEIKYEVQRIGRSGVFVYWEKTSWKLNFNLFFFPWDNCF